MQSQPRQQQETTIQTARPGWLEWAGQRVCLFDLDSGWESLHRAYFDEVGTGADQFLYEAGLRTGAGWHSRLAVDAADVREIPQRGLVLLGQYGYGSFALQEKELANGVVQVSGHDSMEAWCYRHRHGQSDKPVCGFTCGLLAGIFSSANGQPAGSSSEVQCVEMRCAAVGAEQCCFAIGPSEALESLELHPLLDTRSVRWQLDEIQRSLRVSSKSLDTVREVLAAREAGYRNLLDNMNDALLVLGPDKQIIFCNKRFHESAGLTLDEALGSSPLDQVLPEDVERVERIYEDLLTGKRSQATYVFRTQRPSGVLYLECSARAITGPDAIAAIEILARDVTEREHARRELEAAHKALLHKQRIADKDLLVAKLVHESLLPKPVDLPELAVDVKYVPVARVGGDYCHIIFPDQRRCILTLCDVSGHGTASALLASRVSSHVRLLAGNTSDPLTITRHLNSFLRQHFAETGLFVTFFVVVIDLDTFRIEYCGAGHPPPILYRRQRGIVESLMSQNLPVGIIDSFLRDPPSGSTEIEPGDRLVLYTDGLTETMNAQREPFRAEGLEESIVEGRDVPLFALGDWILKRVDDFRHEKPHDDLTLLLVEAKTSWKVTAKGSDAFL